MFGGWGELKRGPFFLRWKAEWGWEEDRTRGQKARRGLGFLTEGRRVSLQLESQGLRADALSPPGRGRVSCGLGQQPWGEGRSCAAGNPGRALSAQRPRRQAPLPAGCGADRWPAGPGVGDFPS